jgi:hypothetical protein
MILNQIVLSLSDFFYIFETFEGYFWHVGTHIEQHGKTDIDCDLQLCYIEQGKGAYP